MRKFIYILLMVATVSLSISSCTDENVEPTLNDSSAIGGGGMDPKKP